MDHLQLIDPLGQFEHIRVHLVQLRGFCNDVQLVDPLAKDGDADSEQGYGSYAVNQQTERKLSLQGLVKLTCTSTFPFEKVSPEKVFE